MLTQEQKKERQNFIGASDVPVILGVSPYKTRYQLWQEKLGLWEQPDNGAMKRGRELELEAFFRFNEMVKVPMRQQVVVPHKELSFFRATLDCMALDCSVSAEIKCPSMEEHEEVYCDKIVPQKYYVQLQAQMECSDHDWMYYVSWHPAHSLCYFRVKREREYGQQILGACRDFWKCVQDFEAPELTQRDKVKKNDTHWSKCVKEYQIRDEKIKTMEQEKEFYKQELIKMGDGKNCEGGGITLTKIIRRGNVDYKAIKELENVDLEEYRKNPITTWRISNVYV